MLFIRDINLINNNYNQQINQSACHPYTDLRVFTDKPKSPFRAALFLSTPKSEDQNNE